MTDPSASPPTNALPEEGRRPIPSRVRPYELVRARKTGWTRVLFGRDITPTYDEWRDMAEALWEGDEAMDALVAWMVTHGRRDAKKLFDRACEHGIGAVADAPRELAALFAHVERDPPWLDRALLEQGTRFLHRTGLAAPYVLRDVAQMPGFLFAGFNQTLVLTGAYNKGTAQRFAETAKWWIDCTEPGGMQRGGAGYRVTLQVRLAHAMVRHHLGRRPDWDAATWGIPISQPDMLATQLAFSVILLGGLRLLGVFATRREADAVMHLVRYIGWLMGVHERFAADTETEGRVLFYRALMTQARPDATSREMGRAFSREPLERVVPWLADRPGLNELVRRVFYHQHLSLSSALLRRKQRVQLGLPEHTVPWFPALVAGPTLVLHGLFGATRLGRDAEARLGRKAQLAVLATLFGGREHGILRTAEAHPAHA